MFKLIKRLLESDNPGAEPLKDMVDSARECGMPDDEIEMMLDRITTDKLGRKWNPGNGETRYD